MDRSSLENIKVLTSDAAKGLEIEPLRLREWISRGFIKPAQPSTGRGSKVYLDIFNLYQIAVFKLLLDEELVSRDRAAWIVRMLKSQRLSDWDMKMPLFLSFYRMMDGYEQAGIFSDVVCNLKLRTQDGDMQTHHIINIGEIILKINQTFRV
jgi:hypothetical protein